MKTVGQTVRTDSGCGLNQSLEEECGQVFMGRPNP